MPIKGQIKISVFFVFFKFLLQCPVGFYDSQIQKEGVPQLRGQKNKKKNRKQPLQISSGTFWALLKQRQRRIWAFLSRVEMRGTKLCGGGGALWTCETSNQFRKQQEADALPQVVARWDLASPLLSSPLSSSPVLSVPVRIPVFPAQMRDIPDTCVKLQASFERWIPLALALGQAGTLMM